MIKAHMATAENYARLSTARRLQVGAIIVKEDRIISIGYNGMPAGWDNNCEDREYFNPDAGGWLQPGEIESAWPFEETTGTGETRRYRLKTKAEVLHAEMNSLMKLARSTESGDQATMFITHSPCIECAKGIYQAGITEVFYREDYRSEDGIQFLKKCGIKVKKVYKDDK